MSDQLKLCPFCGEAAEIVRIESAAPDYPFAVKARCTECHQHALGRTLKDATECATEAWNRRPPVTAPAKGEDPVETPHFKTYSNWQQAASWPSPASVADVQWLMDEIVRLRAALSQQQPAGEGEKPQHELGYALTCAEKERDDLAAKLAAVTKCLADTQREYTATLHMQNVKLASYALASPKGDGGGAWESRTFTWPAVDEKASEIADTLLAEARAKRKREPIDLERLYGLEGVRMTATEMVARAHFRAEQLSIDLARLIHEETSIDVEKCHELSVAILGRFRVIDNSKGDSNGL